ncbi:MAG: succinylglutamate-semialdehyde dehydrogenase [Bdellovibrio sp.]|nr:MAG: succinylglutamate-semialdehyde dehydrogenase [Bdellovibrio sp.]
METKTIEFLGDFYNGSFQRAKNPDDTWQISSPSDKKDTVICPEASFQHIEEAVASARRAFPSWAHLGLEKRKEYFQRLIEIYQKYENEMAETIARETGKPLWEAQTEAKALSGKINVTINHSLKRVSEEKVPDALPGVDGYVRYKPRGVMAVLGPFNFPAHLPNGHIVPALLTGNTVVFKPSDKTAAVGQLMAKMFAEAEFPEGVFNLVQGRGETGKRLVASHQVDGILFTGSYEVGLKIKQETLTHYWKILALEMGGKNSAIVWEDADLEKAVYENIVGAYLTSGQRCSATSKIILHKSIADTFLENFYETAKKLTIGHWKENAFMGALVSADSVDNYLRFQEIAKREGAECIMRGKALDLSPSGNYVTPSIYKIKEFDPKSVYQQTEIFGPSVSIYTVNDLETAFAIANGSSYGLVHSVFTKDRSIYEKALLDIRVGLVNWNRTTNGASSKLPFGGMKKSGNDRPSADFAVYYCTVPVASLEDLNPFSKEKMFPGISYQFHQK